MTTKIITAFDTRTGDRNVDAPYIAGALSDTPQPLAVASLTVAGVPISRTPQFLAAAGATQGDAGAVAGAIIFVSATASTEGVRLPVYNASTSATGDRREIYAQPSVGNKVYPGTNEQIEAIATNVAQALTKAKANIYVRDAQKKWRVVVGA